MNGPRPLHSYPPLVVSVLAVLALLAVLPSGLNIASPSPAETLEYAPVPPEGESDPSQTGNFSSLGLGSSSGVGGDGGLLAGPGGGDPQVAGAGKNPSTKRCVGNPPRQTEDPLSPPCVAHFQGNNFGSTYQGVSGDEIRVLLYMNGGTYAGNSKGTTSMPPGSYWDLATPTGEDEPVFITLLRAYQHYFNDRFQTYDRFVHFYVRFADPPGSHTPESRAADSANDFQTVKPAVVLVYTSEYAESYIAPMARRGVVTFLGNGGGGGIVAATEPAETFRRYASKLWGYYPSVEERAEIFVSYLCRKVVPHPVSFSGSTSDHGSPRRLGLLHEANENRTDRIRFGNLVKQGVEACGGRFVAEGRIAGEISPEAGAGGSSDIARFVQAGVTTIVRTGANVDVTHGSAASAASYYPEWIIAGDGLSDANLNTQVGDPSQTRNSRAVSHFHLGAPVEAQHCFSAAKEADPSLPRIDVKNWSCGFYPALRMLFTGIQVAGPKFSPVTLDQGFHAIPDIRSTDPRVPSCYYETNDYTCVKDAVAEWWDPSGEDPGSGAAGCWRVMEGGKRYTAGTWDKGNVDSKRSPSDPCNFQGVGAT